MSDGDTMPTRPDGTWADVEVGQVWYSRDKRDADMPPAQVLKIQSDFVLVYRFRESRVSKRNFHKLYERRTPQSPLAVGDSAPAASGLHVGAVEGGEPAGRTGTDA